MGEVQGRSEKGIRGGVGGGRSKIKIRGRC